MPASLNNCRRCFSSPTRRFSEWKLPTVPFIIIYFDSSALKNDFSSLRAFIRIYWNQIAHCTPRRRKRKRDEERERERGGNHAVCFWDRFSWRTASSFHVSHWHTENAVNGFERRILLADSSGGFFWRILLADSEIYAKIVQHWSRRAELS